MTLMEALYKIDQLKPNSYSQPEKIRWLSVLDGTIKRQIIDTHEGADEVTFSGYDENTNLTTVLLVPHPYDEIYIRWLEMHIDYANGEYGKYNNSMTMYNMAYSSYFNEYNRTHMPLGKKFKFI